MAFLAKQFITDHINKYNTKQMYTRMNNAQSPVPSCRTSAGGVMTTTITIATMIMISTFAQISEITSRKSVNSYTNCTYCTTKLETTVDEVTYYI